MRFPRYLLAALIVGVITAPTAASQTASDSAGVIDAVRDYVEGFYEGDTLKLARSVRTDVTKYGFARADTARTYRGMAMPWSNFISYAQRVKQGGAPRAKAPRKIEILDVLDQTAAAKLTAWWGTDYLLLAKYDGKWMISHVLWQSPPPGSTAR